MVPAMVQIEKTLDPLWEKIRAVVNAADKDLTTRYASSGAVATTGVKLSGQFVTKLVSMCIGLAVSFTITYVGMKYLGNVLDPTREEKKAAQKRVGI